ncbi:MAG: hydroxysqualene dehydroxylase HpnE [Pirellulales bacterium]|nr:hydroxysqualene dehydroxylase HpnE [Pirellulales bacterium]
MNDPVASATAGAHAKPASAPRVAIVGGGLAGLAAAVRLCEQGFAVELFETRRRLGGRATSFRDPESGDSVDHCQHVSMGCCTNLADFARRAGIADLFDHARVLHFLGPDGRRFEMAARRWLPAPIHLAPGLLGLSFLTLGERMAVACAMLKLARLPDGDSPQAPTVAQWLAAERMPRAAIERFWAVVLTSALGESLDRASIKYARKVFVDGFMASAAGYVMEVPTAPLDLLYGVRLQNWLVERGVQVRVGMAIARLERSGSRIAAVVDRDGSRHAADLVVLALPWRRALEVLGPELLAEMPGVAAAAGIESAPITGVHLWFDRAITELPHAVLVGQPLSQWLFARGVANVAGTTAQHGDALLDKTAVASRVGEGDSSGHYYQVVISASRGLAGLPREEVLAAIVAELRSVFPAARGAQLLRGRVVTEQEAVFSVKPGTDRCRPPQQTTIANLVLAGDWTATGWPSTMEGAVRSGYLAAECVLAAAGRPQKLLVPDLPRSLLSRLLW